MLLRFCLLVLGISLTFSAEWVEQTNSAIHTWHAIASSSNGIKLAACVLNGYIYTSSDSGVTWVERTDAGSRNWHIIASSSDGTKLAVAVWNGYPYGGNGYIYTSSDSGVTWIERTNAGSRDWYGIASSSDGTKLAAGVWNGYIYASSDSGVTWVERTNAGSRQWWAIASSLDGTKLAATVNDGYIYTSSDSGVTWIERTNAGSRGWYAIASSSDGTKLVAGVWNGYIYTSSDSGVTWVERTNAGGRFWYAIASSSDGTKLAAALNGGNIYTSTDSGATWVEQANAGNRFWSGIALSSDGTKIAAAAYDSYIYTIDSSKENFQFTGGAQSYTVRTGATSIQVEACGAHGHSPGGAGGFISAIIPVTPGQQLWVYVGGGYNAADTSLNGFYSATYGNYYKGYNGGGYGGYENNGGGGTDIRTSYGGIDGSQNVDTRLLVAGGGGGYYGGAGGGLVGADAPGIEYIGKGGSQVAGGAGSSECSGSVYSASGSLWQGGACINNFDGGGQGGGGGYYGGGCGGTVKGTAGGGGGGSSYVTPTGRLITNTQGGCGSGVHGYLTLSTYTGPTSMEIDGAALCDFNNGLTAGKSNLANWCVGSGPYSPCSSGTSDWTGVTCGTVGGVSRVVALDLHGKGLAGTLPTSIGDLDSLSVLNLYSNSLSSSLPSEIGLLTNLQSLQLYINQFIGSLPSTVGNLGSLTVLNLGGILDGSLPSQLGLLTNLQMLGLCCSSFTSAVPDSFCNFGSFITLQIDQNPGLTCLPSCLTTGSYANLNKDSTLSAVCAPTPSPTLPISSTWVEQTGAGNRGWGGIASSSDGIKLAATPGGISFFSGYIYTSSDSGVTWAERTNSGSRHWGGIASSSDGTKLAATDQFGYIYTSSDSGVTWVEQTNSGSHSWSAIASSSDGVKLAAITTYRYIHTSTDSGVTWVEQFGSVSRYWIGIASSSDGTKLAAITQYDSSQNQYIRTSSDSGVTWVEQINAGINSWRGIVLSSDGVKLAATTDAGYIHTSTDSGVTWVEQFGSGSRYWRGIASSSDGTKLAATAQTGYIHTSSDSGVTWVEQPNAGSREWIGITSSSDGNKLAAIPYYGYIYTINSYTGPTASPTPARPTNLPTAIPTRNPTAIPTVSPTARPTAPTALPTARPTAMPTIKPTGQPTRQPSGQPTREPSGQPTTQPSTPTGQPSSRPSIVPTSQPSSQPTLQPTFALQTLMSCNVSTGLVGATAASFGTDEKAVFSKAMAQSITESSGGKIEIDSTAVTVSSVTDSTNLVMARLLGMNEHCDAIAKTCAASEQRSTKVSLEALLFADGQNQNRYLVGQSGVVVLFQLAVTTQQVGNSNPSTAFTSLSSALSTAVTSGTFNTNFQAAAIGVGSLSSVTSSATAPLVGTPLFTVTHSAQPSGMPTGQPTTIQCPAGYYHSATSPSCLVCPAGYYSAFDSRECSRCKPGTFAAAPGSATCNECDKGSYAGAAGMTQCNMCSWPRTTVFPGQRECGAFAINLTFTQQVIFGVVAIVIYLSCCALTRKPELVAFSIFPCLDVMSDLLYLLQNTFYNEAVFVACIVSIVFPNTLFLRLVIKMGALTPHILLPVPAFMEDGTLLWLGYRHGYPLFRGERLSFSFDKHDSILKAVAYWVVWAVCIALQAVCVFILLLLYSPYLAFQVPFCALWLLFGFFLYQIKMMAVGRVWTVWFRVWRRRDNGKHDSTVLIDTGIMNESLFAEFLSETVPQLLLQSINSSACQQLNSGVAIFSISLSVFMTCNGLYRYWYYTYFLGYEMRDVPLEVKIGTTVIRLEHATHNHGGDLTDEKAGKLCDADSQIAFISKDRRFNALVEQLNDPKFFRNELKYLPHKVRLLGLGAPQTLQAIRLRRAKERRRARELSRQLMRQLSATSSSTGGANDSDSDSDGGSSDVELEFEDDGNEDEDALACAEKGNAIGGGDVDVGEEGEEEEKDVWRDHGHEGESTGGGVSAKAKSGGTTKSGKTRVKGLSIEPSNTPPTRRARLSQAARRSLTAASTWATHLARDPIGTLSYNALTMRDSIASKLSGSKAGDDKAKQQRPQPEAANSLSWLDLLDVAVAELGFSKLPVINDLFIHMALKSFSKHGIVSERTLHTALVPYAGASGPGREKFALLIAALELDGVFYEHVLGSFFETSWSRFEELGKGANYDWPLEEDKARETVLAAEGTVGGKDTGTGKASEGHETTIVDDIPPSAELALLYPMASDDQPQKERQADDEAPPSSLTTDAVAAVGGSRSPARRQSDNGIRGRAASLLQWRRTSKPNAAAAAAAAAVVAEEASASTQSAEATTQRIETETETTFQDEGRGP